MRGRSSGVLLHPTSLPGSFGVGDLGPGATAFLDALSAAGQSWWQMLPLTPPGTSRSPFECRSAFAGDRLLISPEVLHRDGYLPSAPAPPFSDSAEASLETAADWKDRLLRRSWEHFRDDGDTSRHRELENWCEAPEQEYWLDDWALFAALDGARTGPAVAWDGWSGGLARREPEALGRARRELADEIAYQRWVQFLFHRQLGELVAAAGQRGIGLIGDLPIYVSFHSADVWARRELFQLDAAGRPTAVAGVPPDAFTELGQRWGNPLYDWPEHRREDFEWWGRRLKAQLAAAELLRIDHFRGFVAYWRVPASDRDARGGRWVRGPGRGFFDAVAAHVDASRLIAEDLGHIRPAVHRLRERPGLRGRKVLQFAFGQDDSDHHPRRHTRHSVVYTGTHDNDTLRGWYETLDEAARERVLTHLGADADEPAGEIVWRLVATAFESVAELAIVPAQDLLGLGGEARMNRPGTTEGNWAWRMDRPLDDATVERLRDLTESSGRLRTAAESAR